VVASLRGAYPSIIAGVFGAVETGLATNSGILVVGAADGADFAGAWDGIRAW
jgi:GTPase